MLINIAFPKLESSEFTSEVSFVLGKLLLNTFQNKILNKSPVSMKDDYGYDFGFLYVIDEKRL